MFVAGTNGRSRVGADTGDAGFIESENGGGVTRSAEFWRRSNDIDDTDAGFGCDQVRVAVSGG